MFVPNFPPSEEEKLASSAIEMKEALRSYGVDLDDWLMDLVSNWLLELGFRIGSSDSKLVVSS